jgi:hypothetical protein
MKLTFYLDHDYDGIKELDNNLPPWWACFMLVFLDLVFWKRRMGRQPRNVTGGSSQNRCSRDMKTVS